MRNTLIAPCLRAPRAMLAAALLVAAMPARAATDLDCATGDAAQRVVDDSAALARRES